MSLAFPRRSAGGTYRGRYLFSPPTRSGSMESDPGSDDTVDRDGETDVGSMGMWMAIGIAIGVAIGAAMDNVGLGIVLGVVFGVAIGAYQAQRD